MNYLKYFYESNESLDKDYINLNKLNNIKIYDTIHQAFIILIQIEILNKLFSY